MTKEEKQKAIDALKISVPVRAMTQEEFNDYIQAINQVMDWLEQEPSYNSVNSLAESKLKNPKEKTFDILHFIADNAGLSIYEAIEKAYIMGASGQEPCKDAISRKDIYFKLTNGAYPNETIEQFIDRLVEELEASPSVTPTHIEQELVDSIIIPKGATREQVFEAVFGIEMMMAGLKNMDWWKATYKAKSEAAE